MSVERMSSFLSQHAWKLALAILIIAALIWLFAPQGDPVKAVETRCKEQKLPVHVIKLEGGSNEETRFFLMVAKENRTQLPDGRWMFCRANLILRPREGRPGGR
jgi:hypothetical protein